MTTTASDDLTTTPPSEDLTTTTTSDDLTVTASDDLATTPSGCGTQCVVGTTCTSGSCTCVGNGCPAIPGAWHQLPAVGLPAMRVRALGVNQSGHIFATGFLGVWRSIDNGATFTKVGTPNTTNDPPYTSTQTMGINSLGEPVVGMASPGSGTTSTMLARYSSATNTWITSTATQQMNLGGYFPIAFRRDIDGALLATWPFRNDIMRSTDGGSAWTSFAPIPNATHTPPAGPSASVKAVYGIASHPISGELFCGTEGDQWWHSTDRGATWSMIDAGGSSNLALEPGQNGFLVTFNKDGEALFGTQGKDDGNFLMRQKSDGTIVSSNAGLGAWAMVGTASAYTVLRELPLTSEGHNFLAMPVNDNMGGSVPADLYGSVDGSAWEKITAPFVPELNAVYADGATVLVGGGTAGVIWRFVPTITNHLPHVSTGFATGTAATTTLTAGLSLTGNATDADGQSLTYAWKARGAGTVTFGAPTSAATTASFSAAGDYVLTLHASDGTRSAGAPLIVHVTN